MGWNKNSNAYLVIFSVPVGGGSDHSDEGSSFHFCHQLDFDKMFDVTERGWRWTSSTENNEIWEHKNTPSGVFGNLIHKSKGLYAS